MVNRVVLVGTMTRDAETLNGARGVLVRMRMRTTSSWRDADGNRQDATEFHNLVAYNRLAQVCGIYCMRGRLVYVEGRLRTREYDGSDGLRRMSTEIVVDTVRLLAGADNDDLRTAVDLLPTTSGRPADIHEDETR